MKKKILFLFVLFFVNIFIVHAKIYNCRYESSDPIEDLDSFSLSYDTESMSFNKPSTVIETNPKDVDSFVYDLYEYGIGFNSPTVKADEKVEEKLIESFNKKCQKYINICLVDKPWTVKDYYAVIFNDTKKPSRSITIFVGSYEYDIDPGDCHRYQYKDGNGEDGYIDIKYKCSKYNELYAVIKNRYKKYTSCKKAKTNKCTFKDENGKEVTKATSLLAKEHSIAVDEIKAYCKSVIANQNSTDSCMTRCLSLESDLSDYLLNKSTGTDECSLTTTIITFVSNILKWVKYIAPVLVIILSIIDFIKAIIAQNDDEMKKVQGKFIKRLIVAALLFLLPLIINFMLKTFGFYDAECDVANLFS